ncbi:hypothetical protein B9G55_22835 [Saccharibacillus sp. O16]|nr:hypothetical protein B9G55_22835 [Saccharibacillus sp. O16]
MFINLLVGGIIVVSFKENLSTDEVFGISNEILTLSYVDRGNLDEKVQRFLQRRTHLALRGESKCGKSWFRQKNIADALVVQCRYKKTVVDIYTDALSQLGIRLIIEETTGSNIKGKVEASTSIGSAILAKIAVKLGLESESKSEQTEEMVGRDINDLRYIAEIIINSGKRLVIEDFHYLSVEERKIFSYDLKTLWDYGCFVVVIGVWSQNNMLIYLNADLSGRIKEFSIYWSDEDLKTVISKGSNALNIKIADSLIDQLVSNCFGNVGILQQLILLTLDEAELFEKQNVEVAVTDAINFSNAAQVYADQLNALYQQFAKTVSYGIRRRRDSTGIYAHAMAVIVDASDEKLINGLDLDEVFRISHQRQPRILKNNMRVILTKLEELQVDEDGRGLVIAFNESTDEITAVDRQLLFYRRHLTVNWPWEDLIAEAERNQEDPNQSRLF